MIEEADDGGHGVILTAAALNIVPGPHAGEVASTPDPRRMPSLKTVLIVLFLLYGIPLFKLRYTWRSMVYRRSDWKINILPWFWHDMAALCTNRYFRDDAERAMARRFRWYLAGYLAFFAIILWLP